MADVVQQTQQEFWRPAALRMGEEAGVEEPVQNRTAACPRCGTEYLLGSRFCHSCGVRRPESIGSTARADAVAIANLWGRGVHKVQTAVLGLRWSKIKFPLWLHHLHFHEIKNGVGLSTGSLIAFVIGLSCVVGALLVGLLTVKTFVDWQAIQFYRAEWLLAATASFVGGILLKKQSRD